MQLIPVQLAQRLSGVTDIFELYHRLTSVLILMSKDELGG
jgi:hypothetical protein